MLCSKLHCQKVFELKSFSYNIHPGGPFPVLRPPCGVPELQRVAHRCQAPLSEPGTPEERQEAVPRRARM